jgi:MFS family permease
MGTATDTRRPDTWVRRRFAGLPPIYWLLIGGVGVARLGFVVVPFRAYYLSHQRHLTEVAAVLVMTAFGAGWAMSQPAGGWLADKYGRRMVIVCGGLASAVAFLAYGAAHTPLTLAFAAWCAGLTFDVYRPAVQAAMVDVVAAADRTRALALLYLVLNVGRGVACIMGGLLAEHWFWSLFVLNALVNTVFGLVVWRTVPAVISQGSSAARPQFRVAFTDRRLAAFTGITLAFYAVHMQSVVTLPLVIDAAGASPLAFGLILALDPLAVAVVQLLLQHWLTRASALLVCSLGVAIVGVGLAVTGFGHSVAWFAATTPIWVAGEVMFLSVAPGVVAGFAPSHLRGVYFGTWGATQGAAALLAPALASWLIAAGGTGLLWWSGALIGVLTAAACIVLRGWLPRLAPATSSYTPRRTSAVATEHGAVQ